MDESNIQVSGREKNSINNANNVRNVANMASKSANPYAKAAGTGIKLADKASGGKASANLSKALSKVNQRRGLAGRLLQRSNSQAKDTNDLNNDKTGFSGMGTSKSNSAKAGFFSMFSPFNQMKEDASDGGGQSAKVELKVIKWVMILSIPVAIVVVFCCLFMAASQIYLNVITLGNADKVSSSDANEKIKNSSSSDWDKEIKDENSNKTAYVVNTSSLVFVQSKLQETNLVKVNNETNKIYDIDRYGNEADLSKLYDYYSDAIKSASNSNQDMDVVHKFYFKLFYIQRHYRNKYFVYLDMPLLMATLRLQSSDMGVVFAANTVDYDMNSGEDNPLFDYDKEWKDYVTNKDISTNDIEVLAQNMVSHQVEEYCLGSDGKKTQTNILKDSNIGNKTLTCADGETYSTSDKGYVIDEDKYKEFLKEFIEKKYFLENSTINSGLTNSSDSSSNSNINNPNTSNSEEWRNWRQCDSRWSNKKMGPSDLKMCDYGCLATSISIQIARSGTTVLTDNFDPSVAASNFSFTSNGILVSNGWLSVAPNFVQKISYSPVSLTRDAQVQAINFEVLKGNYIVLGVNRGSCANGISHWVALDYVDLENQKLYIIDPGQNDEKELYSAYQLCRIRVFEKKD